MREAKSYEFEAVWKQVKKVVEEHGGYSKQDVKDFLETKDFQAHVYEDGEILLSIITEIIQYPRLKIYLILFAGGAGIGKWKDTARAYFKDIARINNCDEMQVVGRFGWGRVYPETKTAWAIYRERI